MITFGLFEAKTKTKSFTLARLCVIHEKISDACLLTENYFSTQILVITLVAFIDMLLAIFRILEVTVNDVQREHVQTIGVGIFMQYMAIHVIFFGVIVFGIISVCVDASEEVKSRKFQMLANHRWIHFRMSAALLMFTKC